MLFVPLPLFATLCLVLLCVRFCLTRDMRVPAHRLFALLVGLYAVQSLLSSLRWGYEIAWAALPTAVLAPVLPVVAYLAYAALSGRRTLWPLAIVLVNWLVFAFAADLSDPVIVMTYFGFGILLLRLGWNGVDQLALSPISDAQEILIAVCVTGACLIASGVTDIYIIYDFVQNGGQNAGLVLTFVQTAFVLVIGGAGMLGRATPHTIEETTAPVAPPVTQEDSALIARLEQLFEVEKLHRNEDLSLRRLSRRLGVPDRQVSLAVNRLKQVSVSQFVNQFRIADACALLKDTDRTVLDVSLASGFATKSNFNREFLRVVGQSPSQWRRAQAPRAGART